MATMGSLKGDWKDPNAIAHGTYAHTTIDFPATT